jgi:hypothetical protein
MPEDKRPRPMLEMSADPANKPAAKLEPKPAARRGGGFFSHFFAALVGGGIVAGAGYLGLTGAIPGVSLTDPVTRHQIRDLQDRVASALRAASEPSATDPANANELRARFDGMVVGVHTIDEQVQGLAQKVQALEDKSWTARTQPVDAEIETKITPLAQRISAIERDVEQLTRAQAERVADARSAALTLALTNLKRAISDGRPFAPELAAVENLSNGKLPVMQLAAYKDEGVPSLAELERGFRAVSKKAIERHYQSKSDSFVGDVISRAKAAIQVRPAGSTGDTIEAILGRMESQLRNGNIDAAIAEAAALDAPAQEEMKPWLERARARASADEAIRKTDHEVLASLTKTPSRRQ